MSNTLLLAELIPGRGDALSPPVVCWWTNGGSDSAGVPVVDKTDIATTPQLKRMLRPPPSVDRRFRRTGGSDVAVRDLRLPSRSSKQARSPLGSSLHNCTAGLRRAEATGAIELETCRLPARQRVDGR
jgi:hypothetical protein